MPKNYYNITHWKTATQILSDNKNMSARELKNMIGGKVTVQIAERLKRDFDKIKNNELQVRINALDKCDLLTRCKSIRNKAELATKGK